MKASGNRIATFVASLVVILGSGKDVAALSSISTRPASAGARSFVELYNPSTNTEVVLLGCLHGSLSSSNDVKHILLGGGDASGASESHVVPDAVVLELCQPRYDGILECRAEIVEGYGNQEFWEDLKEYCGRTIQENGPIQALLKITLGTTSLVQTNLSGIRSGLEFKVAMDIVEEHNGKIEQNNDSNNPRDKDKDRDKIRLVLGDREIDETMDRIASLSSVSLELLRGSGKTQTTKLNEQVDDDSSPSPIASITRESGRLWYSIFGDPTLPANSQICMPKVLLRNSQARQDLGRLLLVPSVVATMSALLLAWIVRGFEPDPLDVLLWDTLVHPSDDLATTVSALGQIVANSISDLLVLLAGYVVLALPASKVIISERDDFLTRSMVNAMMDNNKPLSEEQQKHQQQKSPQKIVAILGLLHVNGVAQQLVERGFEASNINHSR